MTPDWLGALLIGVIGAGHCMGMCGGIASMLTMGQTNSSKLVPVFYNLGRLISYAIIGAIVGGAISSIAEVSTMNNALTWLRLAAAVFMILLAFYIGRWWQGLLYVEKIGQKLWKFISPAGKSLLPLKSPLHALPFGFIWGWLPCGLVYSTLTWSAVSGSALNGALIMLAFGAGTLPAMLLMGFGATYLHKLQQSSIFRNFGALLILSYGIYTAYGAVTILSLT
ncbi:MULTISPECIES: sulfite exporter TauE/SafE family protein [Vibrio]|uniref:sulfite exporter TauE/SafE family protein n=1 Tax=Vibrio TaxID=662 RepID=UPI0001B93C2A|nr:MULTISPECIES: sulfite exporter TauE/SafE family protein [Vibrio]EEX31129.1 membrane protein [Vibrio coralliilyticus ATCC BAA-450]ERB64244.1 cytochrome biogenesis protein [Vibrio coralliilyticus OCN008]MDE3896328.1 sulfite exporter TauE/SafE family protein [Vibrio sp. CC007]QIJ84980.1 sulfite exporter TauE/SafE family protein [Vibrio coralliilyticus OCN008]